MMEYKPLFDELRNESDRACAVLSRGILEVHLQKLLEKFFIKNLSSSEQKDLFNGNGPLSTFSARIKMCYAMGLIRKMEKDALNALRLISNDFAHSIQTELKFDNQDIKQKIESIEMYQLFWNSGDKSVDELKVKYDSNRKKFEFVLAFLVGGLKKRIEDLDNLPEAKMVYPPIY